MVNIDVIAIYIIACIVCAQPALIWVYRGEKGIESYFFTKSKEN